MKHPLDLHLPLGLPPERVTDWVLPDQLPVVAETPALPMPQPGTPANEVQDWYDRHAATAIRVNSDLPWPVYRLPWSLRRERRRAPSGHWRYHDNGVLELIGVTLVNHPGFLTTPPTLSDPPPAV